MTDELPLPEPRLTSYVTDSVMRSIECNSYTADQMRAYGDARAAAATERERERITMWISLQRNETPATGKEFAAAIRGGE